MGVEFWYIKECIWGSLHQCQNRGFYGVYPSPHIYHPTFFVVSLANNFRSGIVSSATLTSLNGHRRVKAAFLLKMVSGEATSPTSHQRISNRGIYSTYTFSCSLFVCESYYLFPVGTGDIFQRGCPERSF